MNNNIEVENKICEVISDNENRCHDYDEDCALVENHLKCFLGLPYYHNGKGYCFGQAKGYCPFLQTKN